MLRNNTTPRVLSRFGATVIAARPSEHTPKLVGQTPSTTDKIWDDQAEGRLLVDLRAAVARSSIGNHFQHLRCRSPALGLCNCKDLGEECYTNVKIQRITVQTVRLAGKVLNARAQIHGLQPRTGRQVSDLPHCSGFQDRGSQARASSSRVLKFRIQNHGSQTFRLDAH